MILHGIFMVYFMKSWRSIHDSWTHHEGFMNKFRAVQLWGFPDPCSGYPSRLSPWQQPHGWAGSQGCCERASGEAWDPWRSSAAWSAGSFHEIMNKKAFMAMQKIHENHEWFMKDSWKGAPHFMAYSWFTSWNHEDPFMIHEHIMKDSWIIHE